MNRFLVGVAAVLVAACLAAPAQAAFPGSNGKLALTMNDDAGNGDRHLGFVQPDGTGFTTIPWAAGEDPIWSPDGTRLAVTRGQGGVSLYSQDGAQLEGGAPERNDFYRYPAAWFPDGHRLQLVGIPGYPTPPERPGLYIGPAHGPYSFWEGAPIHQHEAINPDGTRYPTTTNAVLSPDGTRLAYSEYVTESIRVINLDGTGHRSVTPRVNVSDSSADIEWSPDGRSIAFPSIGPEGDEGSVDVWVVDVDAGPSSLRNVTDHPGYDGHPAWSPDGTTIAFLSDRSQEGRPQVWRIPASGGTATQLTDTGPGSFPIALDWQPLPGTTPPPAGNRPPSCTGVKVSHPALTASGNKLAQVTISGATDPDGGDLSWKITGVTQDEPTGRGGADAVRTQWSRTVALRRERDGKGDGRVYAIAFKVTDTRGASCTGTVTVSVPKGDRAARDSGQDYDAFTGAKKKAKKSRAR